MPIDNYDKQSASSKTLYTNMRANNYANLKYYVESGMGSEFFKGANDEVIIDFHERDKYNNYSTKLMCAKIDDYMTTEGYFRD